MVGAAAVLELDEADRAVLLTWSRSSSVRAGLAVRAKIVLAAADGEGTSAISRRLGVSRPTVIAWRKRFAAQGLAGLNDADRSGRPKTVDDAAILARTLEPPPARLGVTHWSTRLLGADLGIGDATVARTWRKYGVQPWRRETFKFSTDPQLEAKVRDVVGLYLNPPTKAVVLCVDEKSQIQALNRTAPILPLRPGLPEKATHDYVRNGTTTLFAALEVSTGKVTDACYDRHGKAEFGDFLKKVARAYPRRQLHIVVDNYHTHKHPEIQAWLEKHPRIHLHFTPTSGSWLNLVEVFFGIITRQAIRRGTFDSVKELIAAISRFIEGWNERCHPFVWTQDRRRSPAPPSTNFRRGTLAGRWLGAGLSRLGPGRPPAAPLVLVLRPAPAWPVARRGPTGPRSGGHALVQVVRPRPWFVQLSA
jgi:transposase